MPEKVDNIQQAEGQAGRSGVIEIADPKISRECKIQAKILSSLITVECKTEFKLLLLQWV